jgi:hypothetical protein
MPRSVKDILEHADNLARRFEEYDPSPDDERDPVAYLALHEAALGRSRAERAVQDAVAAARQRGYSWRAIGAVLGTSGEAARQRYAASDAGTRNDAGDRPEVQRHADDWLHDAIVQGLLPELAGWGLAFIERTTTRRGTMEILGSADTRLEIVADWLEGEVDVTIQRKGVEDVTVSSSRLPRDVGRGALTSHLRAVGRSLAANAG